MDAQDGSDVARRSDRETDEGRREAEQLRKDRERAERAAAKEADRARRDAEKARQAAQKQAEVAARERERLEHEHERVERAAAKETERAQRERERSVREAEREAAQAQREAAKAVQAAALAQQRAARQVEKARARAIGAGLAPDDEPAPRPVRLPREVEALWRTAEPGRRGPRPSLSLERIVDAAIALADAEGIGAVSMARLAESLGFTTMSLYRYVASKDEVAAMMTDRAAGTPPSADDTDLDWRSRMERLLRHQALVLRAHPWLPSAGTSIHTIGPNRLAWMEAMLAALGGTGLPEHEKVKVTGLLAAHALDEVRIAGQLAGYAREVAEQSAADGEQRVSGYGDIVAALIDPAEHPALVRAVAAAAFATDAPAADDLGLGTRLILDGVTALITAHATVASPRP